MLLLASVLVSQCQSFAPIPRRTFSQSALGSSTVESQPVPLNTKDLEDLKQELVQICTASPKPGLDMVRSLVQQVEQVGEQVRFFSCGCTLSRQYYHKLTRMLYRLMTL